MSAATTDIVKLRNAGENYTMTVEECGPLSIGQYPEIEFVGDGTAIRVPQKSADRQLERLGLDYAGCVGLTLKFSRGENKQDAKKPYWNIDVVSGGNGAKQQSGNRSDGPVDAGAAAGANHSPYVTNPPAATVPAPRNDGGAPATHSDRLYTKIATYYCDEIIPILKRSGVAITHEGTSAAIAAIYIQANQKH